LLLISSSPVQAYPGQYYADGYGFEYPDGNNTWLAAGTHSGMYQLWSASNPSVHYSICNHAPVWPWTLYHNNGYELPNAYLNGNGLFVFAGYGIEPSGHGVNADLICPLFAGLKCPLFDGIRSWSV
jgi:hypothetical protein